MFRRGLFVLVLSSMALVASAQDNRFQLIRKANPGDVVAYKLSMKFKTKDSEIELTGDASDKVIDFVDGLMTTERILKNLKLRGGDVSQDIQDINVTRMKIRSTGEIVSVQKQTPKTDDYRIAQATQILVPYDSVAVGDSWTRDVAADHQRGTRTTHCVYKALKTEEVGGQKLIILSVINEEIGGKDPIRAEGTARINVRNGVIVSSTFTMKNFPMAENTEPTTVTITQEQTSK